MDEYRKLTLQRRAAIDDELRGFETTMEQLTVQRSLALARLGELDWLLQALPPAPEHQPLGLGVPMTPESEPAPRDAKALAGMTDAEAAEAERRGRRNIRGEVREAIGKAGARGITVEAITESLVDARPVGITTALEYCSTHSEIVWSGSRWYLANMAPSRQVDGQPLTSTAHPVGASVAEDADIDPAATETIEMTVDEETGEISYAEPAPQALHDAVAEEDTERRVPRPLPPAKDGLFDPPEENAKRGAAE